MYRVRHALAHDALDRIQRAVRDARQPADPRRGRASRASRGPSRSRSLACSQEPTVSVCALVKSRICDHKHVRISRTRSAWRILITSDVAKKFVQSSLLTSKLRRASKEHVDRRAARLADDSLERLADRELDSRERRARQTAPCSISVKTYRGI